MRTLFCSITTGAGGGLSSRYQFLPSYGSCSGVFDFAGAGSSDGPPKMLGNENSNRKLNIFPRRWALSEAGEMK